MSRDTNGKNRQIVAKWLRDMLPKKCCNCGATKNLQYHHIVPAICGGNDVPTNIAVLCGDCHSKVHYGKGEVINHGECIKRGQAEAKKRSVRLGKKPGDYEKIMRLIAERSTQFNEGSMTTEHEIMAEAGVKEVCYAKCKRMLFAAMSEDEWPYEWAKPTQVRNMPLYDRVIKKMRGTAI